MEPRKREQYQSALGVLASTKRHLLALRNIEHDVRPLTGAEQERATKHHKLIRQLTEELESEGVLDKAGLLTPEALELELQIL